MAKILTHDKRLNALMDLLVDLEVMRRPECFATVLDPAWKFLLRGIKMGSCVRVQVALSRSWA